MDDKLADVEEKAMIMKDVDDVELPDAIGLKSS